jgi:hypothetical protein
VQLLAPNANGQVGPEENAELQEVERSLVAAGGDDVCYVGFSTYSGKRKYLFYVKSAARLNAWARAHRDEVERRTIIAGLKEEPGWGTYNQLVLMATEAMGDMLVFMKVRDLDADMTKPRRVDWALYFPQGNRLVLRPQTLSPKACKRQ